MGMQLVLKMSGLAARRVPGSAKGTRLDVPDGTTVSGLMEQIGLPASERFLVIVNDSTVARDKRQTLVLSDGDRVSIVPPLKGG